MPDNTTQEPTSSTFAGTAVLEPVAQPAPAPPPVDDRGGVALAPKVKNAIVAGGIGIAVLAGILGFGAGYIVGDNGSGNSGQMPGMNGQMPGMNGQMPGMNGQMPGMNGQQQGQQNQQGQNQMPPGINGQQGQQQTGTRS